MDTAIRFRGTVEKIDMMSTHEGSCILAAVDPAFVVIVKILSVEGEPGHPLVKAGNTVAFCVHSAVKLFPGLDGKGAGGTFDFTLHGRVTSDGKWSFYLLALDKKGS